MDISSKSNQDEFMFKLLHPKETQTFWSRNLDIIFVLQGKGTLCLKENNRIYAIEEDDIFVINPFEFYILNLDKGALALSLSVSPMFISHFCKGTPAFEINCKSYLFQREEQSSFDGVRRDFACVFQTQYKNEAPLPILLRNRVGTLLLHLIQNYNAPYSLSDMSQSNYSSLRKATDFIHKNYQSEIGLSNLAEEMFLSTSYLSHMFQKQLGQTFTSYVTQVRLSHALMQLTEHQTITDIALNSGFPSANAFIEAFKKSYGMTPGQYKKQYGGQTPYMQGVSKEMDDFSHAFSSLARYAKQVEEKTVESEPFDIVEINCDVTQYKQVLKHKWRFLLNAGYAKDLLNVHVRSQIEKVQSEIGFRYIRCKGYLDDDMMVCLAAMNGETVYNFSYVDEVIDFLLSLKALPWIELGHMPFVLARDSFRLFRRPTILSMPVSIDAWLTFITALMEHLNERYGEQIVGEWIISPFFSPEYALWNLFTLEEYMQLYDKTRQIIKKINPKVKIAGAGTSLEIAGITEFFVNYCIKENCLPDIFSFQAYHNIDPKEETTGLKLLAETEAFPVAVSGDENFLKHRLKQIKDFFKKKKLTDIPIVMNEWSNNIWQRDLCNDTSYKSAYFFKNILENYDDFDGMGYWTLSDQMEEIAPSAELFHGGFGLFTRKGLPKAGYIALQLLKGVGNRLLKSGEGYFISSYQGKVRIFLYNYAHYDTLYRYRHTTALNQKERYQVFNTCHSLRVHINLEQLEKGDYRIVRQSISPEGGNPYDAWIGMGAPDTISELEMAFLKSHAVPMLFCQESRIDGTCLVTAELRPHEVQLITLQRMT